MNRIGIINYGLSNFDSVLRAVEECGGNPMLITDYKELSKVSHIILPGVGSFQKGMENLRTSGFEDEIKEQCLNQHIPLLGICLGMQLLASYGFEGGQNEGLGLIEGEVKLFVSTNNERIPHIGWNEIVKKKHNVIVDGIHDSSDFYFVHSYHFIPKSDENIIATTPYCGDFMSIVNRENIFGCQFHPEKSSKNGFRILKNFLNI